MLLTIVNREWHVVGLSPRWLCDSVPRRPAFVALADDLDLRGPGNTGGVSAPLPSWPNIPPAHGSVVLRASTDDDVPLAVELGADPYVPLIGTLVPAAVEPVDLQLPVRPHERAAPGGGD